MIFNIGFWLVGALLDRRRLVRVDYSFSREPLRFGKPSSVPLLRHFPLAGVYWIFPGSARRAALHRDGSPHFFCRGRDFGTSVNRPFVSDCLYSRILSMELRMAALQPPLVPLVYPLLHTDREQILGVDWAGHSLLGADICAEDRRQSADKYFSMALRVVVIVALAVMSGFAFSVYAIASEMSVWHSTIWSIVYWYSKGRFGGRHTMTS